MLVTVAAGEDWDPLVARCVADGLSGLECLSGIPGLAGATPIQNVGAYGQEVAQTLVSVRAYDRQRDAVTDLPAAGCGFGYRTSAFKRAASQAAAPTGPQVILGVTFRLERGPLSAPLRYPELAARLGAPPGRPGAAAGRQGRGARPAPGQGHGAGPGRSRHPQRRLVLHQPGAGPGRGSPSWNGPRRPGPASRYGYPGSPPRTAG